MNPNPISAKELLIKHSIDFRERNGELLAKCIFNDCDKDSRPDEYHLYIGASSGLYQCKKCGEQGNLVTLGKFFGENFQAINRRPNKSFRATFDTELVLRCHKALPLDTKNYLNRRGVSDELIEKYKLGWGSFYGKWWITIPVKNQKGDYSFFKLRQNPTEGNDKMTFPRGGTAQLYNWEIFSTKPNYIVVSEGEMDCLLLTAKGIPAVTSTHGAGTFKREWVQDFNDIATVYLCFDNDPAGKKGMERIARIMPKVKIVTLPEEVGAHGDITDYFIKLHKTADDFKALLQTGVTWKPSDTKGDNGESSEEDTASKAELLLQPLLDSGIALFHDQNKNGYLVLRGEKQRIIKLDSKDFRSWFPYTVYCQTRKLVSKDLLEKCVSILQGMALYENEQHELQVRLAEHDGAWWYDLGEGRAIKINEQGWEITNQPPILFRNFTHQKNQVIPEHTDKMLGELFFSYAPLPLQKNVQMLILVWLVVAMIPGFPHPILVAVGPQGSRKSTLSKILKLIIDPSEVETFPPQTDMKEVIQIASHHHFIPLDNLSRINEDFSDILCRIVSGSGFSKRELYTNDEDVVYKIRGIIGINGINNVVEKPDLLERSLIIALDRPDKYKEEKKLFIDFQTDLPKILGALFNALVATRANSTQLLDIPGIEQYRMTDFVRWGCVAAQALGYEPSEFLEAWRTNSERQHEEAIDASPFAQTVIAFMEDKSGWDGTPTTLLGELRKQADANQVDHKRKPFPQGANTVWKNLQVIKMNLEAVSIHMDSSRDKQRHIKLYKTSSSAVDGVGAVIDPENKAHISKENDAVDSSDGNDGSLDGLEQQIPF